ncbi:Poly(ADP-ribose) glycohydrolase ARH3 [Blattella germanica]|nr:Poly(ADP-ribose) glycohydrolase ARH3 [Blattella germanica]
MAIIDSFSIASKFRGCLVGSLLGDCLGAPYEGDYCISKVILQKYFDKLDGPYFKCRFVKEYFLQPRRGYGQNVIEVFHKLRAEQFEDPFGPAKEQFEGSGSYGNGGAMRVAPLALFCYPNFEQLVSLVKQSAEITHTHKQGYDGTLLQVIYEYLGIDDPHPYQTQLNKMQDLLDKKDAVNDEEVEKTLGNSIAALYSVPTAIYCFLRAYSPIPEIETDNPFRRTLQYAISLGGDTDTIACMAGAIAGAYYGYNVISESLQKHCEATENFLGYADKLHKLVASKL